MHTVVSEGSWGSIIVLDGEAQELHIMPGQRWLPRATEYTGQFKVGQIISLNNWLSDYLGVSVAIVSRVRDFQQYRNGQPSTQIELLGLPLQWFSDTHFNL